MDVVLKPFLITIWLLALLYFSIPKKEEYMKQYEVAPGVVNKDIGNFSIFLALNAALIMFFGLNQIHSSSLKSHQFIGIIILMTGIMLCIAAYGIWKRYSWGRIISTPLMILVTILVIYSTDLIDVSLIVMDDVDLQLKDYFILIDWVGTIKGLIKMSYLAFLSVFSLRFLEKPSIKANISKKM